MADITKETDGPSPLSSAGYDFTQLPDWDNDFVDDDDFNEFARALSAPENSPSQDDLLSPHPPQKKSVFITALNDWRPVHQRVRKKKKKRTPRRGTDETREGFVYTLLKWPLLLIVFGWLFVLGASYLLTRFYIYLYEQWITWRGRREALRRRLNNTSTYEDWVAAAKELDNHLGNEQWKKKDEYAYYDSKTIRRIKEHMEKLRAQAEKEEKDSEGKPANHASALNELRGLVEACVKNNFVGTENPHLYSESYYGTKDLVQGYIDEIVTSLTFLSRAKGLTPEDKRTMFKHLHNNFGRTALCLSGGATFAYYHFGVAKALLDANLLPDVITGTSGGALVAGLLGTRTDDELKRLLVPALANRITACHDDMATWFKRWYTTGARFDSVDWARRCAWFTRGSLTFREAYQRTGRILNVSCVPSDPHSPTILANYLTSPDCVIWSAVLASAAVPGILNPVVLMKKRKDGRLEPYSFGHKWKDGSLRTDIPLKALNLHFNVRFSIVSQVNPHVSLFFFSSRGSVGRPVTHRRGRGWRGGFLGSATEQYLKLDLTKWLKVLRHLELLPRPLGQDWSEIWLQRFSGTITIWPKTIPSDFWNILSDPSPERLARMISVGQHSAFPKMKFIANRMAIERLIEEGRKNTRPSRAKDGTLTNILSEEDLKGLLKEARRNNGSVAPPPELFSGQESSDSGNESPDFEGETPGITPGITPDVQGRNIDAAFGRAAARTGTDDAPPSPSLSKRISGWWNSLSPQASSGVGQRRVPYRAGRPGSMFELRPPKDLAAEQLLSGTGTPDEQREQHHHHHHHRRSSATREIFRQSRVFIDDSASDDESGRSEKKYGGEDEDELRNEEVEAVDEAEEALGLEEEREREDEAVQKYLSSSDEDDEDDEEQQGWRRRKSRGTFVG